MELKTDRIIISNEERQKATGKKSFIELSENFFFSKCVYPDIQNVINSIESLIGDEDTPNVYFRIRHIEMTQKEFDALPEFTGY